VTAPDLVEVVSRVLRVHLAEQTTGHYRRGGRWAVLCSCGHVSKYKGDPDFDDTEHAAHQAAAVLQALTEAGTVEWATEGVEWDGRTIEHNTWPDEKTARRKTAYYGGRVVSRLTLPWTPEP